MFKPGAKDKRRLLLVRCASILLMIAVSFVNVPLSFAEFGSDAKATFSASVTIGGGDDADHDGMPDSWEELYGINASDINHAYADNDSDGINNLEEYRMGTNPNLSNSGIVVTINVAQTPQSQQPVEAVFVANVVNDGGHNIVKYEWDFDGGGTYEMWRYASDLNGNIARYKYTSAGVYREVAGSIIRRYHTAKVRVTNTAGGVGIATAKVYAEREEAVSPPTAEPEYSTLDIASFPTTVQFKGSASGGSSVVRYQWDTTGNGEYDISLVKSADVTKTFNEVASKSFNASLKVIAANGLSDIDTVDVNIDASGWINENYDAKPRVVLENYPNNYIIDNAMAGVPVELKGYGIPQSGNSFGYATKLEWDFEGDGVYEWSSSLENSDWTGRADVYHTYGAPGMYRAVLRIYTNAGVSATDSVLVIVSQNGTPPAAAANVSYNGTADATEINGAVPVRARFNHSLSSGSITKYEWDFDGDKRIDYSTASATDVPTCDYKFPGYYLATLRATNSNGLTDTFYIPVFAYYSAGYASSIALPSEGKVIAGNAVTLDCDVFPDDAGIRDVMFQYRKEGDTAWTDIGLGRQVRSYMATLDTTPLQDGATYQLRAIVNGADSASFKITSVVVDNLSAAPDIYENRGATYTKTVTVDPNESNTIVLSDGTTIDIPYGAIPEGETSREVTIKEERGVSAGVGNSINITGIERFSQDITISIPYPDEDNNGIVDGTSIDENDLVVFWFNTGTNTWDPLYNSVIYPDENYVSAKVNHLTLFGLGPLIAGAGIAAGSGGFAISAGRNVSYCFIATAAYGTPMADDVMVLREFRDRYLIRNEIGRSLIWHYYLYSPPVAKFIKGKPALRAAVRFMLKPLVNIIRANLSKQKARKAGVVE